MSLPDASLTTYKFYLVLSLILIGSLDAIRDSINAPTKFIPSTMNYPPSTTPFVNLDPSDEASYDRTCQTDFDLPINLFNYCYSIIF